MMCHWNHARNYYWQVALLTTGLVDTFIDPFRTTTLAQSPTDLKLIVRDTQESVGIKFIGVYLRSWQKIGIHSSNASYPKLPSRSLPSFLKPSGPSI